jgi:hypothetical protein
VGGTFHGFTLILSSSILAGLWKVTVYLTGFSSFFLLSAVLMAGLTPPVRRWALALSALKLVVYLAWMVTHDDFLFVVYDYGSAMILILIFQVWAFYKHQPSAAGWVQRFNKADFPCINTSITMISFTSCRWGPFICSIEEETRFARRETK